MIGLKVLRKLVILQSITARDTFHFAGVGAGSLVITQGIPRLREIVNLTKNLKNTNMTIFLKEEFSTNKDSAKKLQAKFSYTQLKDILSKTEILYDNKDGLTDKHEDREFIKSYKEFTQLFDIDNIDESCLSPWILRLTFDKESLMNRKITIQDIQETIKENSHNDQEINCVYSDDSSDDVIMRIQIKQDSKGNFLEFMKDFEKQLIELPLRGIADIKQVEVDESNIIKYNHDGSFTPMKEWVLKTTGSNLIDILAEDAVDTTRTETNDIIEFFEIYGIEATRDMIYKELMKIFDANNPNPRHVQMLADLMTYRGKLMQIDRHGLNKNPEVGPIAKASFEEVMNIFTKAALFAEKDNMKGVSANIFAGQFCKAGTNSFEILMDEDKLMEKVNIKAYVEPEFQITTEDDVNTTFNKLYEPREPDQDVDDDDFEFGFGMEEQKEHELGKSAFTNIVVKDKEDKVVNEFNEIKIEEIPIFEDTNYENIDISGPVYEEVKEQVPVLDEPVKEQVPVLDEPVKEQVPLSEEPVKEQVSLSEEPVKENNPVVLEESVNKPIIESVKEPVKENIKTVKIKTVKATKAPKKAKEIEPSVKEVLLIPSVKEVPLIPSVKEVPLIPSVKEVPLIPSVNDVPVSTNEPKKIKIKAVKKLNK